MPDPRGALRGWRGIVRRWRPDVVHSHMVHANLLARLTRLLAPMPVQISTAHSLNEGARWREIAYRITDPLCTLTTNVCRACVERYVRGGRRAPAQDPLPAQRPRARAHSRDDRGGRAALRRSLGVGDAFVWLAVGRIDVEEGLPHAAARGAARAAARPPFVVLVAGGGPERRGGGGAGAASSVCTARRCASWAARRDVPELMRAADGFLMSSVIGGPADGAAGGGSEPTAGGGDGRGRQPPR